MTKYEKVTTTLSIIAIIVSIMIPLGQLIWKKFIMKPKVDFYQNGQATLFFNQSGSYFRIDGAIEAKNKAVSVKKISASIKRQKDNASLNLSWNKIISPSYPNLLGNYIQTTEIAHPFRVYADNIICTFIEFADAYDSFGKSFRNITTELFSSAPMIKNNTDDYFEAVIQFLKHGIYPEAKDLLLKEFFWKTGKYYLDISIEYDSTKKVFCYEFSVSESDCKELEQNIEESLIAPIKTAYNIKWDFHSVAVELIERKE